MSVTAIEAHGLGKQYRIGGQAVPYKTLRESLTQSRLNPRNLLRRPARRERETFWALRDLDFEIAQGEVVGIVGRNGAGKSTLLKLLASITEPTAGWALLRGRVGSLLEVGTGFHPELSGRENIFLNGAILGMGRSEIAAKFDQIVEFAEVERFVDTPVKHYSSGMYLRLAFALAAHLEPEILLVDEVLAVGDAAFQQRCLGKMSEVARAGRTVLFVSHNMGAVRRLCHHGMLLDGGRLVAQGSIEEVIDRYAQDLQGTGAEMTFEEKDDCAMPLLGARLLDARGEPAAELERDEAFALELTFAVRRALSGAHVAVMLDGADGTPVCHGADVDAVPGGIVERAPGRYRLRVAYPGGLLNAGVYKFRVATGRRGGTLYDYQEPFVFTLRDGGSAASLGARGRQRPGVLALPLDWRTETLDSEARA